MLKLFFEEEEGGGGEIILNKFKGKSRVDLISINKYLPEGKDF